VSWCLIVRMPSQVPAFIALAAASVCVAAFVVPPIRKKVIAILFGDAEGEYQQQLLDYVPSAVANLQRTIKAGLHNMFWLAGRYWRARSYNTDTSLMWDPFGFAETSSGCSETGRISGTQFASETSAQ
jgi:hypothetical protein